VQRFFFPRNNFRMKGRISMGEADWRDRILLDPAIHHGDPCIRGTRVPVSVIIGSIADGDTLADVLAAYPSLTEEDVRAALRFAAEAVTRADFLPLKAAR
jgi:uncharacterized protein (DUF433 family)